MTQEQVAEIRKMVGWLENLEHGGAAEELLHEAYLNLKAAFELAASELSAKKKTPA